MTMPTTVGNPKTKISVSLNDEAAEAVAELVRTKGLPVSEIIRRGIALERFIEEELENGSSFFVKNASGETERVRFIFG